MSGHWFCRPPNVTRDQPQHLWDPCLPLSKELVTPCRASLLSLWSQAGSLSPRFKMHFPQCFVLFQHLWESSDGSFGIYFGPFLEHPVPRGRKGKLCHVEIFPSGHSCSTCTKLWRARRRRGKGKSPNKPNANHNPNEEGGELLPALQLGCCLGTSLAAKAGGFPSRQDK